MVSIIPRPKIFVGNIGLHSLTLCGDDCDQYLHLPQSKLVRSCVVIEFNNEESMLKFLQSLVDKNIPFESTYKSETVEDALYYREHGKLTGKIISFDWGAGGAIYKTE